MTFEIFRRSLEGNGFAPFIAVGNPTMSWENKTLNNGGMRVEIVDQFVCSLWCPRHNIKVAACDFDEAQRWLEHYLKLEGFGGK